MAVKSKDLLILILMVICLATKSSAGGVEQWKRGNCMETSDCKYQGGKCYRKPGLCESTDTVTKQCTGEPNCVCCIPIIDNACPRCGVPAGSKYNTADYFKRIAGGVEVQPKHKYPWLVLIKIIIKNRLTHCGGQIINSRYVLTAAHCLNDGEHNGCNLLDSAKVYVGMHRSDLTDGIRGVTRVINVVDAIEHEDYQRCIRQDNDIALLRLEEDLDLKNAHQSLGIGAICLPQSADNEYYYYNDYHRGIAAGWGATYATRSQETNSTMKVPQDVPSEVSLPIGMDLCGKQYRASDITDNMLCAGRTKTGKDACFGDSGGPLMMQNKNGIYELIGVTSFGPQYCNGGGAYTRVNQYLDWIAKHTNDINCNMLYAD